MTVQCFACDRFRLKGSELARHGFGKCKHEPSAGTFFSALYRRECSRFAPTDEATAEGRRAYLENRKETRHAETAD